MLIGSPTRKSAGRDETPEKERRSISHESAPGYGGAPGGNHEYRGYRPADTAIRPRQSGTYARFARPRFAAPAPPPQSLFGGQRRAGLGAGIGKAQDKSSSVLGRRTFFGHGHGCCRTRSLRGVQERRARC